MTPDDLRKARRKLGLSAAALARALELGEQGGRTVRRWESASHPIPGPVRVCIRMWLVQDAINAHAPGDTAE